MAESVEGGRVPERGNPHGMDWTPLRDVGKAEIPVSRYVSDDYYAREKERIWRRSWLLIGRESDVSKAGDFFTFYLHVLSTLVIVIRGKDGELRAFHNVCQHRGAQIQHEACGSCRALTCAFHGWVYDLDGSLLNVPQAEQFEELDYEERKLKRIHLDTWGGFVFINLDPADQPEHTLAEWLGPMPGPLGEYFAKENWIWRVGWKGIFEANWKIMVDVQLEGYHVNALHAKTIGGVFGPAQLQNLAFPDTPGMPTKLEFMRPDISKDKSFRRPIQTPVMKAAVEYGATSPFTDKDASSGGIPLRANHYPGAINRLDDPLWIFDDYLLFPNVVMMAQTDHIWLQRVWPISPHRTAWEFEWYFIDWPKNFGEWFAWEQAYCHFRDVTTQDMVNVEGMQKAYRAGSISTMVVSDIEGGVRCFQDKVTQIVGAE